jgi:UDP-glucose 6-dehydrogenase
MLVHIIGKGVVGGATGRGFERYGIEVIYSDDIAMHHRMDEAGVHFICTPEDAVLSVAEFLLDEKINGDLIIRSTVRPGTTMDLAMEYDRTVWHNPEFLRAKTSDEDFLNTKQTLIGYASPWLESPDASELDWFLATYRKMLVEPVLCGSTESEFAKLITNSYLATQIGFWNEISRIVHGYNGTDEVKDAESFYVNSHSIAKLVALDPRVSTYGAFMHGNPYGGYCLPKDIKQLMNVVPDRIKGGILEAVDTANSAYELDYRLLRGDNDAD